MNNILKIGVIAITLLSGCKTKKIQTIEVLPNGQTNIVYSAGFNQESYIWESWFFSTNRVNNVK